MLGAFMSLDFLLFFLFWEVMLVPMYFLIGIWGSDRRLYSAIKFFLYTLVGSVVMLLGILALYFHYHAVTGVYTFDVTEYYKLQHPVRPAVVGASWRSSSGFAIKVPMFPFHTWLPDAHTDAPTAGSVILAAILLKMGTYGFIRFSLPILPDATRGLRAVHGGAVAHRHRLRRAVRDGAAGLEAPGGLLERQPPRAWRCWGCSPSTPAGVTGSIMQQINHGISTGALFLIVGVVYERRHTREIAEYGGLSKVMPVYAAIFLIMTMSSIGLPALNGFIGEVLILQGIFVVNRCGRPSRPPASCWARPTCCGSTSARCSARSRTRRTRTCRT